MKARRKIKLLSLAIIIIMIATANVSFSQDAGRHQKKKIYHTNSMKTSLFSKNIVGSVIRYHDR